MTTEEMMTELVKLKREEVEFLESLAGDLNDIFELLTEVMPYYPKAQERRLNIKGAVDTYAQ